MKKNKLFGNALVAVFLTTNLVAEVKTSTAWFNNETFEAIAAGTNFKATTSGYAWDVWSGWTQVSGTSCLVSAQNVGVSGSTYNPEYGGATGICFGIGTNSSTLTASASGSNVTAISKTFINALSGYVYIKTSYLPSLGVTTYAFKNSSGTTVFELLGADATSKSLSCTGVSTTTMNLGVRQKWASAEVLLDLNSNLAKAIKITYNGTTRSYTDIALPAGTDIQTLSISLGRYFVGGLDNTTIGQVIPDGIRDITSVSNSIQSIEGTPQSTNINVVGYSTAMSVDLPFTSSTDIPVTWTISDWGTMSVDDQAKISISSSGNNLQATLSVSSAISADATITVSAAGPTTLTKTIDILKVASVDGVKALLNSEMSTATTLRDNVAASNPYIEGIKATLTSAISTANNVYINSSSASEVSTAQSTLQTAETAFSNAMTPYNNFVTYIGTVTAGRDTEVRTAPFFNTIKATLTTAISNATDAKLTVASTTDISDAQTALQAANNQFTTGTQAYDNLNTQISTVTSRLAAVNIRKGDSKFLMFPTANVQTLTDAKTAAETSRDNETTIAAMSSAQSTLNTALTTFNGSGRVGPGSSYYRIYTNGADGGDGTQTRSILFAEGSTLKYKTNSSTLDANSIWKITETTTDHYTIQNMGTGTFLNGNTLSATQTVFTLPETKSLSGYATWMTNYNPATYIGSIPDTYFLYGIVSSTPRALEVDVWTSPTGVFALYNGTIPDRYRYCYQFEPVATLPASTSGTVSTSTNWSSGLAPTTEDIAVAGTLSVDKDATSLSNIDIVIGGQLTVSAGKKLTIGAGTFVNNGTFTLSSDGTNGTATFVNSAAITKTITANVEQYLTSGRNWYVSSPVTDAAYTVLSSATSVQSWDEATGAWVQKTSGNLEPGKGYVAVSNTTSGNVTFTGTLNDGDITVNLTRTKDANKSGFNLVGNPYPSYLSWSAVEKTNMDPTVWYRTKNAGGVYKFGTYNATSNVGTNVGVNETDQKDVVTGNIPPMQAFWVRVSPSQDGESTTGSLTFKNTMRAHKGTQSQAGSVTVNDGLLRVKAVEESKVIRLQVSNGTNQDEAIVLYNSNASNVLDSYDSQKMSNNSVLIPEIYTLVGNNTLVINGLNSIQESEIPVGFTTLAAGTFHIKASQMSNFEEGTQIILKDYANGTPVNTDLSNGNDYTFSSDATTTNNRFSILVKSPTVITGTSNLFKNGAIISSNTSGQITVSNNQSFLENDQVLIYNSLGQLIEAASLQNTSTFTSNNYASGIYIVSVTMNNLTSIQKIILK